MIHFLFTSALLAVIGWGLYLTLVRRYATLSQRKGFIYATLITSLALPLSVSPTLPEPVFFQQTHSQPLVFGQINEQHLQQYCRCEKPNYGHRIQYKANAFYFFVFEYKHWMNLALLLAVAGVLIKFLLQLAYLRQLIRQSSIQSRQLDGQSFYLLFPATPIGAGAFQFGKRYIIWQQEMEGLSEEEQKAIFRHELSHLQQHNTLEKAALRLIQCLWFFHPVFYYFQRELELISEGMADRAGATALADPRQYAQLLVRLSQGMQAPSLVQHFRASVLKLRIRMLLVESPRQHKGWVLLTFALLLGLQTLVVTPLSAQVSDTLFKLDTYEVIYHKVTPQTQEAVYCTDCETVCR